MNRIVFYRLVPVIITLVLLTGCAGAGSDTGTNLYAGMFVVSLVGGSLSFSVVRCGGWRKVRESNLFCSGVGWYLLVLQLLLFAILFL